MGFKGLSNAVTSTHPLLPSMGTTRQKSSCRNRLQNGLRLLSQAKVGTHSSLLKGSHTRAHTAKQGAFQLGVLSLPSERSARSRTSPGRVSERQTLPLLGLGRVYARRTQKACGTAMRLCVSLSRRRRGPAGLRDLFRFCRNRDLYIRRSWFSACARHGWYHYPRCAPRAAETLDGRLSKRFIFRFLRPGSLH